MLYSSLLTDPEWIVIQDFMEDRGIVDKGRKYRLRDILDAIFYVVDNGVKWRNLPSDFPPWKAVYYNFYKWSRNKVLEELNLFVVKVVRNLSGRDPDPSMVSIDSQSQDADPGVFGRGIDGNKKRNGRKRHVAVDVMGLLLLCLCGPANQSDSIKGQKLVEQMNDTENFPNLSKILGDKAYAGLGIDCKVKVTIEKTERPPGTKGFVPEAFRWAVERTFAWLNRQRRLTRNYEKTVLSQQSINYLANIRLCLRRVLKNHLNHCSEG